MSLMTVTDNTFDTEVLHASTPVLVFFTATWCGPCKEESPIVDSLAQEMENRLKCVTVDIDNSVEVTKKYGVKSVPTVLVFYGGQKKGSIVGLTSREKIRQLVGM